MLLLRVTKASGISAAAQAVNNSFVRALKGDHIRGQHEQLLFIGLSTLNSTVPMKTVAHNIQLAPPSPLSDT